MLTTDEALLEGAARNMATMWSRVARACGGRDERLPGAWAADAGSPNAVLNRATVQDPTADPAALVASVDTFYAGRAGGPYGLVDTYGSLDLSTEGFARIVDLPCMVRPPGPVQRATNADLRIERARDEEALRAFERVLFRAFHYVTWPAFDEPLFGPALLADDAVTFYVGYVDGEPVSCSASCATSEVVGVYLVATPEEHRGKGYGEALSWAATLADPQKPALLQASSMGHPVYKRMGYREIARIPFWMKERVTAAGI